MSEYWYMVTDNDEMELPCFVGNSKEVIQYMGIDKNKLYQLIKNHKGNQTWAGKFKVFIIK